MASGLNIPRNTHPASANHQNIEKQGNTLEQSSFRDKINPTYYSIGTLVSNCYKPLRAATQALVEFNRHIVQSPVLYTSQNKTTAQSMVISTMTLSNSTGQIGIALASSLVILAQKIERFKYLDSTVAHPDGKIQLEKITDALTGLSTALSFCTKASPDNLQLAQHLGVASISIGVFSAITNEVLKSWLNSSRNDHQLQRNTQDQTLVADSTREVIATGRDIG